MAPAARSRQVPRWTNVSARAAGTRRQAFALLRLGRQRRIVLAPRMANSPQYARTPPQSP